MSGYSLGVGYKGRISSTDAMPVEWFAVLSYEHNQTHSQLHDVNYDIGRDGGGLKAGIRAAVTDRLELMVNGLSSSRTAATSCGAMATWTACRSNWAGCSNCETTGA